MAGGVLTYTIGAGDAASPRYVRPISVTANTWYRAEVGSISGTAASRYFFAAKYSDGSGSISTSSANVPVYIFAPGTTLYIGIGATGSAGTTTILDNVSLQQVVESTIDLSSGLWVRGTIENKTIVNPILGIKLATNGDAVDVWCADLESGAFATSPIEAFGAQVTRAVDVLTLADSKAPWNTSVMSICAKVLQKSTLPTTGYRLAFEQQESGNTIFDLRFIDTNEITCAYGTGTGVGWLVDAVDVPNAGSMYKIAFSSGVASNYLYVNGAQCASANSSYSGTSGVTMSFGNGATPTRSLCGYLQNITLVPRKWSTAELQAKTS
jgi:hypothetical protein